SEGKDQTEEEFESLETPENRNVVQDYNSKLEAYDAERSERENVSLDFNIEDFKDEDPNSEEELMEKEIDSLMNLNKREYVSSSPNSSSGSSPRTRSNNRASSISNNSQTPPSSERKEDVNSD